MTNELQKSSAPIKIRTREESTRAGDKRFFTGIPCRNGHVSERWTSSGACRQCIINNNQTDRGKAWRRAYEKTQRFKQHQDLPEVKERRRERERERGRTPHKRAYNRNLRIKKKYGLELGEFEIMLELQNHACAICKKPFENWIPMSGKRKGTPVIDHCHTTSVVRALLCGTCNSGIGMFDEKPDLLRKAATYVEKMRKVTGRL